MDTKWERNVLTVSAPSTPKSKNLSISSKLSSPSLMSRLFTWNSPKEEGKGLDLTSSHDTLTDLVTEFDPLGKEDWMLQFESPSKFTTQESEDVPKTSSLRNTPVKSLIDLQLPIASPNSIVKYTQNDLENLKLQLESKFNKEFEVAQLEIQEMETHRKYYMGLNKELELKVQNLMSYDSCKSSIFLKKLVESERKSSKIQKLIKDLEAECQKVDSCKKVEEELNLKLKKTELELEQVKSDSRKVLQEEESNLEKIRILESRYESLKVHAQAKLDEANIEIAKTRSNYEKEISTLKTKLQRCELTMNSLERSLALKEEENKELTGICDGLVQQMELERSEFRD